MRKWPRTSLFSLLALLVVIGPAPAGHTQSSSPVVYRLILDDTIQPITAGRLDRALNVASQAQAAALLVELDTPGGLLDSARHMVGAILNSSVPVIVYIAPSGARGGSAGFAP